MTAPGCQVDARWDVYGFACVVYETLAGHPPFRRDDDMALLRAHQYAEPPLTAARPEPPPHVAAALAQSPGDRHDSCLAFVAVLRTALAGSAATDHHATRVDARVAPGAGPSASAVPERPPDPPRWAEPVLRSGP